MILVWLASSTKRRIDILKDVSGIVKPSKYINNLVKNILTKILLKQVPYELIIIEIDIK